MAGLAWRVYVCVQRQAAGRQPRVAYHRVQGKEEVADTRTRKQVLQWLSAADRPHQHQPIRHTATSKVSTIKTCDAVCRWKG